jgi:D-aspartate ligase
MMSSSPPPVVLLGTDCMTGLQASRILWRKGVPVIGVADDVKRAYCRTRSAKRTIATATIWDDPIPLLKQLAAQYNARPVLMPCTDEFVWWLNARREEIGEVADFLLPPHDVLEPLSDKAQFYRYAIEHNLPLPETRIITQREELEQATR